ncbi:glycosyltransferase [Rathayibacter tanaceti]|uniref:D-inositol 3-phosphate glycosyltransferase n=2 Tax=Rathayibacter tanaceti TaxID=1671680 RepID=A0A162GSJ6_9MICO|nr:glycosyltransferase [Rathayibacter tanaceti]KZX22008.1 D-inositol 3-phosphate glycosyltransferase [Rathayibacter tanaceti]QHC56012.1 glycosyltransferase family 1 protein [Rathayibacter tanaceti]TCO39142.1 glycosyl transferase family 1 [Rathayibacter tanaceti]
MRESTAIERLTLLLETVEPTTPPARQVPALVRQVSDALAEPTFEQTWLLLAVLNAELPVRDQVVDSRRTARLEGVARLVESLLRPTAAARVLDIVRSPDTVVIARHAVLVDVHHTARTGLATGIQRVVRNTIVEWNSRHDVMLIVWDDAMSGFREVGSELRTNALYGSAPDARLDPRAPVVVPWESLYVLPELAIEDARSARLSAFTEFSGNATTMIGHDCVPLTTAETAHGGISGQFPRTLVAVSHMDRVATVSHASQTEFRGWRGMLEGESGPDVDAIPLPASAGGGADFDEEGTRALLGAEDGSPLVVCIGSHEPRKNHLAVLHAAELVWRSGVDFTLAFIGGNAWNSEEFQGRMHALQDEGRAVDSFSAITDELLWSAYRSARCTVFPSLNEGFGLPVAESLAVGTPVITSGFGSMKDIAAQGGALLVDPRDDRSIRDALISLITDDEVHARLTAEAHARVNRTWGEYADELWSYVTAVAPAGVSVH